MNLRKGALVAGGFVTMAASFVASWEGLRTQAYLDPVGVPTICYGHTEDVVINTVATKEYCDLLLREELTEYAQAVETYINVPLPDTRKTALTSFAYNVGIANFKRSTLVKLMNEGKTQAACDQLRRWVYAKGIKLKGLVRRREAERQLCLVGVDENA